MIKLVSASLLFTGLLSSSAIASLAEIEEPSTEQVKQVVPVAAAARCEVLRGYYDGKHYNPDRSVFKYFQQWHEGDFAAVRGRLKLAENIASLDNYGAALRQAFQDDTIDFANLLLAYHLYSQVLSDDLKAKWHIQTEDTVIGWSYIAKGVRPTEDNSCRTWTKRYILEVLIDKEHRCLPIVSGSDELTTFRTLNESFGLKTPIVELPLSFAGFDGQSPASPQTVLEHDIENHMAGDSSDMFSSEQLAIRFGIYGRINNIVRNLESKIKQAKCDFFLYLFGHENMMDNNAAENEPSFDHVNLGDSQGDSSDDNFQPFVTEENFYEACEAITTEKIKDLESLLEKGPVLYNGFDRNGSYMTQFVDKESHRFYNLTTLVTQFDIPKDEPIHLESLRALGIFRLPPGDSWSLLLGNNNINFSVNMGEGYNWDQAKFFKVNGQGTDQEEIVDFPCRDEFINRQMLENYLSGFGAGDMYNTTIQTFIYNQLLELQGMFQAIGIDFKVWDGDNFNYEGMKVFFEDVRDTFVREVGPKFKG